MGGRCRRARAAGRRRRCSHTRVRRPGAGPGWIRCRPSEPAPLPRCRRLHGRGRSDSSPQRQPRATGMGTLRRCRDAGAASRAERVDLYATYLRRRSPPSTAAVETRQPDRVDPLVWPRTAGPGCLASFCCGWREAGVLRPPIADSPRRARKHRGSGLEATHTTASAPRGQPRWSLPVAEEDEEPMRLNSPRVARLGRLKVSLPAAARLLPRPLCRAAAPRIPADDPSGGRRQR